VEAAEQLQAFSASFLCDIHVHQLHLDELYAVLRGVKDGAMSEEHTIRRLAYTCHWVWTAIDVGPRTLAMAQCVVHPVARLLAPDCVPLCLTDGFRDYMIALLAHFG
jgi:hypothetical protein